jgi:lipoate-protein ligase A
MQKLGRKALPHLLLWDDPVRRDGPDQMACDEAIMRGAVSPVLRVFRWSKPWVSAGYFVAIDDARAVRPDLPVCRRWTGGGIVVHEGDFTFAFSVPKTEPLAALRPTESYRQIHAALVDALIELGCEAELSGASAKAPSECFAAPVEHDVTAHGLKIAGGAQRRTRHGLLHQGSVQTNPPLPREFGEVLARCLAFSVEKWSPPEGFEDQVCKLSTEKYASERFLAGPRWSMNFTGAAMS